MKLVNYIPAKDQPKHIQEDLDAMDVSLPAQVNKFLTRAVEIIKGYKLPRKKEQLIIAKIIDALNLTPQELQMAVQKIKKNGIVQKESKNPKK
jgi:DNA-binding MarR family transcriptional regulator